MGTPDEDCKNRFIDVLYDELKQPCMRYYTDKEILGFVRKVLDDIEKSIREY